MKERDVLPESSCPVPHVLFSGAVRGGKTAFLQKLTGELLEHGGAYHGLIVLDCRGEVYERALDFLARRARRRR